MNSSPARRFLLAAAIFILISGGMMTIHAGSSAEAAIQATEKQETVTPEGARKFIEAAETKLLDLWIRSNRAQWVHQTFITPDTEILAAQADQVVKSTTADLAAESN